MEGKLRWENKRRRRGGDGRGGEGREGRGGEAGTKRKEEKEPLGTKCSDEGLVLETSAIVSFAGLLPSSTHSWGWGWGWG